MQIRPSSARLLPWQSNPQEQLLCHQLEFDHGLLPRSYKFDNRTHTNQTHLVCCYKYHLLSNRSHSKHTHNNCTHTDLTNSSVAMAIRHTQLLRQKLIFTPGLCSTQLWLGKRDSRAYDHCETAVHTTIARLGMR